MANQLGLPGDADWPAIAVAGVKSRNDYGSDPAFLETDSYNREDGSEKLGRFLISKNDNRRELNGGSRLKNDLRGSATKRLLHPRGIFAFFKHWIPGDLRHLWKSEFA